MTPKHLGGEAEGQAVSDDSECGLSSGAAGEEWKSFLSKGLLKRFEEEVKASCGGDVSLSHGGVMHTTVDGDEEGSDADDEDDDGDGHERMDDVFVNDPADIKGGGDCDCMQE